LASKKRPSAALLLACHNDVPLRYALFVDFLPVGAGLCACPVSRVYFPPLVFAIVVISCRGTACRARLCRVT